MKVINFILKVIKGIIGLFSDICFIILFVYGITFIPYLLGYKATNISSSNNDYYKTGTLIYYKNVDLEELRVGDNILEKKGSDYTIYKIKDLVDDSIDVGDKKTITYGENVFKIGAISVPYLGYYVRFMNANRKIVYLLAIIIVFDMIFGGIRLRPKKRLQ